MTTTKNKYSDLNSANGFITNKLELSLSGLSIISLFIILPVFQFLDSNPFFHFRYGINHTLLALITLCFGLLPIFFWLVFVRCIKAGSKNNFLIKMVLGFSLLLFISHLYSTTLQEMAATMRAGILLAIFFAGMLAINKSSKEVIWGLAWLSILIVPSAIYHGYKQYLKIPELIRESNPKIFTENSNLQNIYVIFIDGSQITSAYLDKDDYPKNDVLPNLNNFLVNDAQWFPNTLANASSTYLSFPSMLSGKLHGSEANNYLADEKNIFSILESRYKIHAFLNTKTSFCIERPESCSPYNAPVYSEPLKILVEMYAFISTFRLYPISFEIGELNKDSYHRHIFVNGFLDRIKTDPGKENFYIIQLFDREASQILEFDNFFGDFVEILKKSNKYDDAIIIVMSDHGFVPGPKPNYGPEIEQTRKVFSVPFAIKTPGIGKGKLYQYQAQNIDIAPTLLRQILFEEEWKNLKFDGVDLLNNRPQREHYINLGQSGSLFKLKDLEGNQPGLVELPLK
ncbi:MAG: sulfatase-like hydrolase/transferase [Nitrospinales bacterium]